MTNPRHSTRRLRRREALHLFGAGLAAAGLTGVGACSQNKEAAPAPAAKAPAEPTPSVPAPAAPPTAAPTGPQTCDTPVDAAAQQMRGTLQYKEVAAPPEKNCAVCAQYVAGKFGECGGCNLFAGPVKPLGGCLAFAPKDPNAPPAAPAPTAQQPG